MCSEDKRCIADHPHTPLGQWGKEKPSDMYYLIRQGRSQLCLSKLFSVFHHLVQQRIDAKTNSKIDGILKMVQFLGQQILTLKTRETLTSMVLHNMVVKIYFEINIAWPLQTNVNCFSAKVNNSQYITKVVVGRSISLSLHWISN